MYLCQDIVNLKKDQKLKVWYFKEAPLEKTIYSAVQANIMAEQEISSSHKGDLCDEAEKQD